MIARRTNRQTSWKLTASALAVAAAVAVHYGANAGWRRVKHREPPDNPAAPDVSWYEALAWTGFISLMIGLARLLASRGAAAGWQRFTGRPPPFK